MKKKITTLNILLLAFATLVMGANNLTGNDNRIEFTTHSETGGITHIGISGDTTGMNWIVSPDTSSMRGLVPNMHGDWVLCASTTVHPSSGTK